MALEADELDDDGIDWDDGWDDALSGLNSPSLRFLSPCLCLTFLKDWNTPRLPDPHIPSINIGSHGSSNYHFIARSGGEG